MKGRKQGECSGCGAGKGTHDSNAGWWEMGPRRLGGMHREYLFCPSCAAAMLVGLDAKMTGAERAPLVVAVARDEVESALLVLESTSSAGAGVAMQNAHDTVVKRFAALLKRKPWSLVVNAEGVPQ